MSGASPLLEPHDPAARVVRHHLEAWLLALSFPAYSALIRLLLLRCGYSTVRSVSELRGASATGRRTHGEGGLDLVAFAHTDLATFLTAVGLRTGRVPLGRRFVDELRGAMGRVGAEQGLLFTTASVSRKTRAVGGIAGLPPVHIVDGAGLAALLIEHRLGVCRTGDEWHFDARFFEVLEERAQRTRQAGSSART